MNYAVAVVGGSRGGSHALATLLGRLPPDFPLPVVAVIHRDPDSEDELLHFIRQSTGLQVIEAEEKQAIQPGHIYIAAADYHLLVEDSGLALSTEGPVSTARPSIDVLFESAAEVWRQQTIGIILTGTGSDGAQGLAEVQRRGGMAIVQDPAEAEFPEMPKSSIAACATAQVLNIAQIASLLAGLCQLSEAR